MSQNEKTSKTVATIASEILNMKKPYIITDELWADILSLAGSALTQAPDKKLVNPFGTTTGTSKLLPKSGLKGLANLNSLLKKK